MMRVTVDISAAALQELKRLTHIDKTSPAVSFVVDEWLKQKQRGALVQRVLAGEADYAMSNDALERQLYDDAD